MPKKIQANLDGVACSHLGIFSPVEENGGGKKRRKQERGKRRAFCPRGNKDGGGGETKSIERKREMRFALEIINFDLCSVSGFPNELDL